MQRTFTFDEQEIVVTRRTVLAAAALNAILRKIALIYERLSDEYGIDRQSMDWTLSGYASLSVSTISGVERLKASDTVEEIEAKCRAYLTEFDPDLIDLWQKEVNAVHNAWQAEKKASRLQPASSSTTAAPKK